jgi:predicted RNase H-like HicB family nuclease
MAYRFLIIVEKGHENYGAYSPDLPGCVAVEDTVEEVEQNMQKAITIHLQGMLEDHEPIPTSGRNKPDGTLLRLWYRCKNTTNIHHKHAIDDA